MPVVFLTSASTSPWGQPGDWIEAGHTVRLIGAGGRGGTSTGGTTYRGGPGGGGGAHVLLTRTSGSLSSTTAFLVGADNSSITDRTTGATCWGSATFANCRYVEAGEGGGVGGTDFNGGLGGDATTTSVGTPTGPTYSASLNNSGGAGGDLTSPTVSGGGGGGAGGPSGAGGHGGDTTTTTRGGGGGGAGNGGGSASATSGVNGTAGAGAGGGAGGTTSTAAGDATGSAGSGGGGGFFSAVAAADIHGGAGGVYALDTQSNNSAPGGPGGGGGGGAANSSTTAGATTSGGAGGNYGAGGGGAGGARNVTSTRNPGAGASGLIAISYSSPSGVAFGSATYLTYASHTNATLAPPAGLANGDLLLAYVATGGSGSSPTVTAPGGWTALTGSPTNVSSDGGFNVKFYIFYKFASSESGSYTFTHSTSGSCGVLARYTGVDTSTPFSPTPTTNTGGADVATALGFTTTVADTFVIFAEHDWSDNSINTVVPTGTTPVFTERADDSLIYIADGKLASPGATGDISHTCNNTVSTTNSKWGAYLIGLNPSTSVPTTLTADSGSYSLTGSAATFVQSLPIPNQWLTFQNQDATDFGTNATNGTLNGSPTFDTGVSPPAIVLNGTTQYVSGTNHPVNSQTTNVTLCCWVNLTGSDKGTLLHVGSPSAGSGNGDGFCIGIGSTNLDTAGNNLIGLVDVVAGLPFQTAIAAGWHHIALTRDSTNWRGYLDGVVFGTTYTGNPSGSSAGWAIGRCVNNNPRLFGGKIQDARFYAVRLVDGDIAALYAAGPQSAAGAVTLAAAAGSYALTGTAAQFVTPLNVVLPAAAGAYALTGTAASFALKQTAGAGSYALTGTAAAFRRTHTAAAGAYTLTGSPASFIANVVLTAATGSYTLTGAAAGLVTGNNVVLPTDPGSYTLTGTDAAFIATSADSVTVTAGNVILAGKTVSIVDRVTEVVPVLKASVTLAGQTVTIRDTSVVPVAKATVTVTGKTVTILETSAVPVAAATVLLAGQTVTIQEIILGIPVGKADILFTGQNVVISTTGEQLPGGGGGVTVPPWRDLGRKKRRRYRALEEIEKRLDQRIERLESEAQEAQEQVAEVRLQVSTAQITVAPDHYGDLLRRQAQITQMLHEAQRRAEKVRQERIELDRLARIASEEADDEEAIAMLMRFL